MLAFGLAPRPGFQLRWVWYLSVASVTLQAAMILLLVRREFRLRLGPAEVAPAASRQSRRERRVEQRKGGEDGTRRKGRSENGEVRTEN